MRVVVAGAGLAGLRAAHELRRAGVDVVVVEAGRRPGGRVRTLHEPFVDGQWAESGAEWVDSHHHRLLELLDRYSIPRLGEGERWTALRRWMHIDGELVSGDVAAQRWPGALEAVAEVEDRFEREAASIADPARPMDHPSASALDAMSVADLLDELEVRHPVARLIVTRSMQGEFAAEPEDVSALFVAQQRAYMAHTALGGEVRAFRVSGGFSRVAEHLADELGDALSLGEPVVRVEPSVDGVVVRTTARSLRADHVVLACSLPAVRRLEIEPGFPAPLHAAVYGLGYGTITKTAVQWPERHWQKGYVLTDRPVQRLYEPTIDQSGAPGILMAYSGGRGGADDPVAEMRAVHGLDAAPLAHVTRAWNVTTRAGGAYAVYRPGEVGSFWDVLRAPCGRVHLAGEHVATCTGYMEGALESGETVARRIISAH